uniref:Uncharacterized protein n=1 Tax=Neogobius melanostomus TaxID=47308 RepID=A0A8C6THP5_9GOBI
MPGYVMPSGNSDFSLLCDSCGEWYGLVQLCVKDDTESLIDYEDQFTDSYKQTKDPKETQGPVYPEVQDVVFQNGKGFQEAAHQDEQAVLDDPGEPVGGVGVNQSWSPERTEVVRTEGVPTTHSPVSLLSQKHMFWFPSEAFQEGPPVSVSTNSATQSSTGVQSNESKEQESKEVDPQHTVDFTDQVGTFDSHMESHNDSRSHEHDTLDSHQDERDVTIYIPTKHNHHDDKDRHDDHYDMGEHEGDRIRVRYDSRDYDGPEQTYEERRESYEDHTEHPDLSQEQVDPEDTEEPYDPDDNDSYEDNSRQHVIFTMDGARQNVSQKATGTKATTDDTWLDGYPIVQKEAGQEASTTQKEQITENPNEIFLNTGFPNTEPDLDQLEKEEATAAARPDPSDSHLYSDTMDYDTQQVAPTNSWLGELTEHPFLDQGPVPPLNDLDVLAGDRHVEEHTIDNLPGETGERGEVE